jgi:hypothetical protein
LNKKMFILLLVTRAPVLPPQIIERIIILFTC